MVDGMGGLSMTYLEKLVWNAIRIAATGQGDASAQNIASATIRAVREFDKLTPAGRDTLEFFDHHPGGIQIGQRELADAIGYSSSTIVLRIKELEADGLLKITRFRHIRGPAGANRYELNREGNSEQ